MRNHKMIKKGLQKVNQGEKAIAIIDFVHSLHGNVNTCQNTFVPEESVTV